MLKSYKKFAALFTVTIEEESLRTLSTSCLGIFLHRWYSWNSSHLIPNWKMYIKLFLMKWGMYIYTVPPIKSTHAGGKTVYMVAVANILTWNYPINLIRVCTTIYPIIIDFDLHVQFTMKIFGLCLQYAGWVEQRFRYCISVHHIYYVFTREELGHSVASPITWCDFVREEAYIMVNTCHFVVKFAHNINLIS